MTVVDRLKEYYTNPENSANLNYIKGVRGDKVVLAKDGKEVEVTIEDLENKRFDFNTFTLNEEEEMIEEVEEPQVDNVIESPKKEENIEEEVKSTITLNDLKTLSELGNNDTLDKVLKTYASDQNGNVDINKTIGIIINNTVDVVTDATIKGKVIPSELYNFDKEGKLIGELLDTENKSNIREENINRGFNNVLVGTDIAKSHGIEYSEEQKNSAKTAYTNMCNKSLDEKGFKEEINNEENIKPDNVIDFPKKEEEKTKTLSLQNQNLEKAGFADVFILSIIVIVYAAIIVNLVLKLK